MPLIVRQYCNRLKRKIEKGEDVFLILDSTGLRFGRSSFWYESKYGKPCKKMPWSKMHLSMDPEMNIHAVEITDNTTADIKELDNLIPDNLEVYKLIADGGYSSIKGVERLFSKGAIPVIPPPCNAVIHNNDNTTWHDKIVSYIKVKKSVYAFHKKYGYGKRALVESQFSRIKRFIGSSLLTEKDNSKINEGIIVANIINLWNSFGRPTSLKIS